MKLIKSDTSECISRTFKDAAGKSCLAVGFIYPFTLHPDADPVWRDSFSVWPLVEKTLGTDVILDEGWPKFQREFLAYGAAYWPTSGAGRHPLSARIDLGPCSKQLAVFGDRVMTALGTFSNPSTFSRMPVVPERAYGGKDWPANPLGRGYQPAGAADPLTAPWSLPNIELPSQLILSKNDRPSPAGFWAYPADHPQRTALLGNFTQTWVNNRWPHLPADTQPSYFQAAPTDQQREGFWKGDEAITLLNLHPKHARIDSTLPGVRARIFAQQLSQDRTQPPIFHELTSRLETVWLLPDELAGLVLFRAVVEIADPDADDVLHLYSELELLSQEPRSFGYHQQRFLQLTGQVSDEDPVDERPGASAPTPDAVTAEAKLAAPAPVVEALPEIDAAQLEAYRQKIETETFALDPDLKKNVDLLKNIFRERNITEDDLQKMVPTPAEEIPTLPELRTLIQQQTTRVFDMLKQANVSESDLLAAMMKDPNLKVHAEELSQTPGGLQAAFEELDQGLAKMLTDEKEAEEKEAELRAAAAARQAAATTQETPESDTPTGDLRQWVINRHAKRKPFKGLDLSGANLAELDLSGADFSASLLPNANFTSARLQGCRFDEAMLTGALFVSADLSGASLQACSAGNTKFTDARLAKVNLKHADCSDSDFTRAQLGETALDYTDFSNAQMTNLQAQQCHGDFTGFGRCVLANANFTGAKLHGVNFNQATLTSAVFSQAQCTRGVFSQADCTAAKFNEANLQGTEADLKTTFKQADLREANLTDAVWLEVCLDEANLNKATLNDANFSGASLINTKMIRAIAKGAQLTKIKANGADLTGINLFEGSLRNAELQTTKLDLANLFGVDFQDTIFNQTSLEASLIERTILHARAKA